MRFSRIALIYFIMGVVVVGTNILPPGQMGLALVFMDVDEEEGVTTNKSMIGGGDDTDGMLDNLIGPVRNALNTITGGALLAVWGPISTLTGFYAWPIMAARHLEAPDIVVMLAGSLTAAFTFGVLRVFRASI